MCALFSLCVLFLFFKQKTAYEMRISDWSSDVCSSDLLATEAASSHLSIRGLYFVWTAFAASSWGFFSITRCSSAAFLACRILSSNLPTASACPCALIGSPSRKLCASAIKPSMWRSEESRVGNDSVSTCRSRWSPVHYQQRSREPAIESDAII